MKVDRRREVIGIAKPARLALDTHDLAVQTFGHAVGDRLSHVAQHTVQVGVQGGRPARVNDFETPGTRVY